MHQSFRFAATLAISAVLAGGISAQQSTTSDAVIQSNVLKAMAADYRLASQQIQTTTAFGTVTISGSVPDEATRDKAEQVVAHTAGVKKVVDQLTISSASDAVGRQSASDAQQAANEQAGIAALNEANGPRPQQSSIEGAQTSASPQRQGQQAENYPLPNAQQQVGQPYPQSGYPQPPYAQPYPQQPDSPQANGYPQGNNYPQPAYPQRSGPYATSNGYPSQPTPGIYRRQYEAQQQVYRQQAPYGYGAQAGQPGGQQVTLAPGVVLPVRITRWLSSGDAQPGTTFNALVENDVIANGLIAIPRGAEVQGTVVEAKDAGALKGRGSLTLELSSLHLGGQNIPLQSQTFTVTGHDKAARSVNSAIGGAAVGAIIGAIAGRGTGAAIGAGVGGAAGLGASAISGGGDAHIPSEELLRFPLTAPVSIVTVSEAEMQRLGSYAGPEGSRRPLPPDYGYRPYPYPGPYAYPYSYRRGYYY